MNAHALLARRVATRHRIGSLAALCLMAPLLAGPVAAQDKNEAAKVAKKVEKAVGTAHQAEEEREALRHFQKELAEYNDLHTKQLAKLGAHPEPVAAQKNLAQAIAAKRAKATRGEIFQPEVERLFRRLIAEQLEGPDALAARKAVAEGNPGNPVVEEGSVPVTARVNAPYPSGATRSTIPPSVLLTLPPLPACLHYRFVGRDLVLVDSVAQIMVDFLPAAAPEPAIR